MFNYKKIRQTEVVQIYKQVDHPRIHYFFVKIDFWVLVEVPLLSSKIIQDGKNSSNKRESKNYIVTYCRKGHQKIFILCRSEREMKHKYSFRIMTILRSVINNVGLMW